MKSALFSVCFWKTALRVCTAGVLSVLLVEQPLLAAGLAPVAANGASSVFGSSKGQMEKQERVLHALNRLTFGPKPGDVEAVKAMGLKKWFERQLNPASIDDSALEARLANFPAMKLSQQALMERFPPPQVLRAMENQKLPLPTDPIERVIYSDQMAFYKMKQEEKAASTAAATAAAGKTLTNSSLADTMMATKAADGGDADGTASADAAMKDGKAALPADMADLIDATASGANNHAHEDKLYSGLEAVKVINLPPDQRMQRILAMSPKELIAFHASLSQRELAEAAEGLTPEQKEILVALPGSLRLVNGELLQSRLIRDIYSDRQLEAVMTDFWLNHFNIYVRKNQNEPYLLNSFERDVIRPNALGKFEDLLVATAKSPAMLMYLDNWQSIGPNSVVADRLALQQKRNPSAKARPSGLNENYARELMELHTLGVGGGYTQADVTQVAKVFTGWGIDRPYRGAAFEFEPLRHEPGTKQVLGTQIHSAEGAEGEAEGLLVLHMLATSPATARFISTKLAVRFVSDDPAPALVDRMTKAFLASHGDVKVVLRAMFDAPEFWSPAVYRAKVKTPLEFVVSAARASNVQLVNAQPLVQSLDKLGMPLYGMQTPNGYDWKAAPWVGTGALVSRMNFALVLTADRMPGVQTGLTQLVDGRTGGARPVSATTKGADPGTVEKEKRLEFLLLGEPVSDRTRATVLQEVQDTTAQQLAEKNFSVRPIDPEMSADLLLSKTLNGATPPTAASDRQVGAMAGLLLGSPEFQRR